MTSAGASSRATDGAEEAGDGLLGQREPGLHPRQHLWREVAAGEAAGDHLGDHGQMPRVAILRVDPRHQSDQLVE